jgi:hypothetical protein
VKREWVFLIAVDTLSLEILKALFILSILLINMVGQSQMVLLKATLALSNIFLTFTIG